VSKDWAGKGRPLSGAGAGRARRMPGQTSGGSSKKGCGKSVLGMMVIIVLCLTFFADCAW
jgi:hypothetical protein